MQEGMMRLLQRKSRREQTGIVVTLLHSSQNQHPQKQQANLNRHVLQRTPLPTKDGFMPKCRFR